MPILLHGAANWPLLSHRQLHRLHSLYLKWIRVIVNNGFWSCDQMSDTQLLASWGLPSLPMRLAKVRLLHAFHMFQHAPHDIVDMITAAAEVTQTWMCALRQALQWAHTLDSDFFLASSLTASTEDILQWFRDHSHDGP